MPDFRRRETDEPSRFVRASRLAIEGRGVLPDHRNRSIADLLVNRAFFRHWRPQPDTGCVLVELLYGLRCTADDVCVYMCTYIYKEHAPACDERDPSISRRGEGCRDDISCLATSRVDRDQQGMSSAQARRQTRLRLQSGVEPRNAGRLSPHVVGDSADAKWPTITNS